MKRWFLPLVVGWIFFHLVAYVLIPQFIPYLGFFPYKEVSTAYHLPGFLTSMANFDGVHYILIAQNGYSQFEQAFFPLYPMLIHFLGIFLGQNYLLAAILISSVSFFLGLLFFKLYLEMVVPNRKDHLPVWRWSQFFLLLFPTSFFFSNVYTEGLFFVLATSSLYFLKKKNIILAAALVFLLSLTRLIGVFLFIPIAFELLENYRSKHRHFSVISFLKTSSKGLIVLVAPFIGLLSYCAFLFKTTGDPLFFLNSQPAFGANRSSHLIFLPQVIFRYIKIFIYSDHSFQYFLSIIELSIFTLVFVVLLLDLAQILKNRTSPQFYRRFSLNIFSFINLLLPTFTGTLSSVPRYALMSFSFFIFLGEMKNTALKIAILTVFAILHLVLFGYFVQGYFVS